MSGRLINIERRAALSKPEPLIDVPGWLMSTGSFAFLLDDVWRIITPGQLFYGMHGGSGDPKIAPDGRVLRTYAYEPNNDEAYFRYYDGKFTTKIDKPQIVLGEGDYPLLQARYYRHRDDDNKVVAQLEDIGWAQDNNPSHQPVRFYTTEDEDTSFKTFMLTTVNWQKEDVFDTVDNAYDTYFGNVIGLGTGVLITERLVEDPASVYARWHDGTQLSVVPGPTAAWARQAAGWLSGQEGFAVGRFHPLCRIGPDKALCSYRVSTANTIQYRTTFADYDGLPFWAYYLFASNGQGTGNTGGNLTAALDPPLKTTGYVDHVGGWQYGGSFNGSVYGVTEFDQNGPVNPLQSGTNGYYQSFGLYENNKYVTAYGGFGSHVLFLYKVGGKYHVVRNTDQLPPGPLEKFKVSGIQRQGSQLTLATPPPVTNFPPPMHQVNSYYGCAPVHACVTDTGIFGMGITLGGQDDHYGVCGPINAMRYAAPNGLASIRPKGAGPFVFMSGKYSRNMGATWTNNPAAIGDTLSNSAGAMSVYHTFKFTQKQIDAAAVL